MKRFGSILVVPLTNRSEAPPALKEAVALARASGARVSILDHLDEEPASQQAIEVARQMPQLRDEMLAALTARLEQWTGEFSGPRLQIDISTGSQPHEVAQRVERDGHDLVVIAADSTAESASAARRILRTCPRPVWMLRPSFTGACVLAAIDLDEPDDHNRMILELARSQAELHGGELHVMHAWEVVGLNALEHADLPTQRRAQLAELAGVIEHDHRDAFHRILDDAGIPLGNDSHFVDGPAARAIQGLTVLYRADLVVIGAGSTSANEFGLGATAEQVLAEIDSSVLVVR